MVFAGHDTIDTRLKLVEPLNHLIKNQKSIITAVLTAIEQGFITYRSQILLITVVNCGDGLCYRTHHNLCSMTTQTKLKLQNNELIVRTFAESDYDETQLTSIYIHCQIDHTKISK